ncbi:MAG TPA: hypothetical protein VF974_06425 [Patescibacteria group bacterium]
MNILKNNSQEGVTLLLSIMIMSGLILIASTVSLLAIQQIRGSRAGLVSEPAFIAAKTGAEEGLWIAKRSNISNLPDCPASTARSVPSSNSFINYCKSFRGGTYNITSGSPTTILLYDPNDPNGDTDLSGFRYNTLTVRTTGSFAVNVNVSRIDGTFISAFQVTPGNSSAVNLPQASPGTEGRMQITLDAVSNTAAYVTTDKGLPTVLNIASTACSTRTTVVTNCSSTDAELYTRKIEVQMGN